jgi:hypothetical protein
VNQDGSSAAKTDFDQQQAGFTLGGPLMKHRLFAFTAFDYQRGRSTKQTDPNRIDPLLVQYFASVGAPGENGPIDRTNDARVSRSRLAGQRKASRLAEVQLPAEQKNGTSTSTPGPSAGTVSRRTARAQGALGQLGPTNQLLNEFRFQWAWKTVPARTSKCRGGSRLFPTPASTLGGYRFIRRSPADDDPHPPAVNEIVTYVKGDHTIKAGFEYNAMNTTQTFRGLGTAESSSRRFPASEFHEVAAIPRLERDIEQHGAALRLVDHGPGPRTPERPVRPHGRRGGHPEHRSEGAAVFIQDKWQPPPNLTVSTGWLRPRSTDPITPADQVFFSKFIDD